MSRQLADSGFSPRVPRATGTRGLRWALLLSAAIHASALTLLLVWKGMEAPARPPQYRVELVGAAGLKRQMGVVGEQRPVTETAPAPAPAPAAAVRPPETAKAPPPKTKSKPVPKPVKATPNVAKTKTAADRKLPATAAAAAAPVAGSGTVKTRGTDVTNMVVDGIAFPYPGYLDNIIRQIKLQFDWKGSSALRAELKFLIHRDGSVSDIEYVTRSGSAEFDREARGAVEAAGNSRAFRPLPSGYEDDVLPVYFTFSPDKPPSQLL